MHGTTKLAEPGTDYSRPAKVAVSSLLPADSPRSSGENPDHVRLLADVLPGLPPILVHRPTMKVIDGMHRLRAAKLRCQEQIAVEFFDGDQADAFVLAVKMNVEHGLPLPLADRKTAAQRIIESRPEWSDRRIASTTGLAAKTVADIRRHHSASDGTPGKARIGKDGRLRPVDSSEGRRAAGRLIRENPGLSLRHVARAAGISPETARDVRHRLNRGEELLPTPLGKRRRADRCMQRKHPGREPAVQSAAMDFTGYLALLRRLKEDPSVRLTATGRTLIRLMQMHSVDEEIWTRIADNLPGHCREQIAYAARYCAQIWQAFADQVERKAAVNLADGST